MASVPAYTSDNLFALGHVCRSLMSGGDEGETLNLNMRQLSVLIYVNELTAPITLRGLSETLNLLKPSVTRILDKLVAADLLAREVDESDRRSIFVRRTKEGVAFLKIIDRAMTAAAKKTAKNAAAASVAPKSAKAEATDPAPVKARGRPKRKPETIEAGPTI